jgi:hypothetical protein
VRQRQWNRGNILNLLITRVVAAQFRYGTSVLALTQANVRWPSVAPDLGNVRLSCQRHIQKEDEFGRTTLLDLLPKLRVESIVILC